MSEIVVTCPDCGLSVKVTHNEQQITDRKTTCKLGHGTDPTNCPILRPALTFARQTALASRQPWPTRTSRA